MADPAHGAARASQRGAHAVPPVFGGRGGSRFSYLSVEEKTKRQYKHDYKLIYLKMAADLKKQQQSLSMHSKMLGVCSAVCAVLADGS